MNNQEQIHNLMSKFTPEYFMDKVFPGVFNVVVILLLTLFALRAARLISGRMFRVFQKNKEDIEFQKRAETLSSVVRYILTLTTVSVAVVMILGELRINIAPVLATAGIVGLAVGFGAQTLVQDVIAGFFILLDDQVRVGDVVEIAGKSGLVEKVDLRMTTLRDLSGNVHYVRHGKVDVVTNMTKDYSHFVFDIPVAYDENIDTIMEILKDVHDNLRNDPGFHEDIIAPIEIMGLDRFAESALIIRARTTTRPMKQWGVAREFHRRLKRAFDEKNIEMPFRQVMVYIGKDKEGKSKQRSGMEGTTRAAADTPDSK
jgi:moderate conductance mechanosensitive channel